MLVFRKPLYFLFLVMILFFPTLCFADESNAVTQGNPSGAECHDGCDDFWKYHYLLQQEQRLQQQKERDSLDREKFAMAQLKRRDQRIAQLQEQCVQENFFKSHQSLCQKINNYFQFGIPISDADLGITTEVPQTPSYQIDQHAIANAR
ncbi:MAG: hypothetical protein K0S08_88 [Gammaproteobacteria bacterium]|jgi:hypothetical protein|nr:hypothetical protein [Gammaproteobacteria bacterium]